MWLSFIFILVPSIRINLSLKSISFQVNPKANKLQIKEAVEKVFNVTVENVNVMVVRGKTRRFGRYQGFTGNWKKALVKLKEGDKIELFEGM